MPSYDMVDQLLGTGSAPVGGVRCRIFLHRRQQIERLFHGHAGTLAGILQTALAAATIVNSERLENPYGSGVLDCDLSYSLVHIRFHVACLRIQGKPARWRKQ